VLSRFVCSGAGTGRHVCRMRIVIKMTTRQQMKPETNTQVVIILAVIILAMKTSHEKSTEISTKLS
jgi:hypothetical protein